MAASLSEALCFGRYEPLFRVAAGGMAEVYAARIQGEAGFQKLVAVKRMLPHLANEPGFVDMFLNEAKLAAHIDSPHVVQTLDLGRGSDGSLYIVMELVVGLSFAKILEGHSGPVPLPIALEVMAQAAQGLDDAHEATTPAGEALGLIHRDVSPHNILLGIDGRVRVTDFGIARAVHRPRAETNARELKGKFSYMSPEQTRLKDLDRRSDVFSLGTVLWEVLSGQRLFAASDPLQAVRLVRKKPIVPPHQLRPEVPEAVSAVALRALERNPADRYQSAGELAVELRRVAREAFGEPPHKRDIARFIELAGGEELERLQRLIRLGTQGAAPEAIEAMHPGVTLVLQENASGIAPLGTAARVTSVLDPRDDDDDNGPPTVMLAADEFTPSEPSTIMVRRGPSSADAPADEMPLSDLVEVRTDPAIAAPSAETPLDPPTIEHERNEPKDDESIMVPTRVAERAPPVAPPNSDSAVRLLWVAAIALFTFFSFGVGSAVVLLWPRSSNSTVLPVSTPFPPEPAEVVAPTPRVPPATEAAIAAPMERHEPHAPEPPAAADEPETVQNTTARAAVEDSTTEQEREHGVAAHEESARPSPAKAQQAKRRAPRRPRRRASSSKRATPVAAEPARGPGTLLGVHAFDRRPR